MKIYAIIGGSEQTIDERQNPECPEGYIEMKTQRPKGNYVAGEDGGWVFIEDHSEKEAAINSAKALLSESNKQIEILQDRIDLDDYESDNELSQIQADLKAWKKYRIELNKFIKGEREDMPEPII